MIDPAKLDYAADLRDQEDQSISEVVETTDINLFSLYRYPPARPPETLTAETRPNA